LLQVFLEKACFCGKIAVLQYMQVFTELKIAQKRLKNSKEKQQRKTDKNRGPGRMTENAEKASLF
jgi:hypothetical protein